MINYSHDTAYSHDKAPRPKPAPEFQAIVFAGFGSNLYPLTEEDNLPKALLPIGSRPMIAYTLQWLLDAGIRDALVLAPASSHSVLTAALRSQELALPESFNTSSKSTKATASAGPTRRQIYVGSDRDAEAAKESAVRVELVGLGPVEEDEKADAPTSGKPVRRRGPLGTADLLRWLADEGRLVADPLLLPVDIVASSSTPLSTLLDLHRSRCLPESPTVTAFFYERGAGEGTGKEREKEGPSQLFVAHDEKTGHLLWIKDADNIDDEIELRMSMLWKYPATHLSTLLLDSSVYIFNRASVLPLLSAHPEISSIREELVPFLVKCGWQGGLRQKFGWRETSKGRDMLGSLALEKSSTYAPQRVPHLGPGVPVDHRGGINAASGPKPPTALNSVAPSIPATPFTSRPPSPSRRGSVDRIGGEAGGTGAASSSSTSLEEDYPYTQCPVLVHRLSEGFFLRANTIPTYLEANRFVLKDQAANGPVVSATANPSAATGGVPAQTSASPSAAQLSQSPTTSSVSVLSSGSAPQALNLDASPLIDPRAQLSADSVVGHGSRIGERTSLKRSVIGRGCAVERNVRLTGCVVMDGVTIREGAKLENCIVCKHAVIGERAQLKDVDVGAGYNVMADTMAKNEKLINFHEDE